MSMKSRLIAVTDVKKNYQHINRNELNV